MCSVRFNNNNSSETLQDVLSSVSGRISSSAKVWLSTRSRDGAGEGTWRVQARGEPGGHSGACSEQEVNWRSWLSIQGEKPAPGWGHVLTVFPCLLTFLSESIELTETLKIDTEATTSDKGRDIKTLGKVKEKSDIHVFI